MKNLKSFVFSLLCISLICTGCKSESADNSYPNQAIKIIVPFGAGSGADRILKIAEPYMKEAIGGNIDLVSDYKTGGGGVVGSNHFMTVKNDGYTLLYYNQPHITIQEQFQKIAYGNDKLTPILGLTWRPDIITVSVKSPFKTFQDLYDYTQKNPGKLTIGTTGSYSSNHMVFAMLTKMAGMEMERIPFDSGAKMNAALIAGEIDAAISNMQWLTIFPGELRVLASSASERPTPEIPTFTELGYPDIVDISAVCIIYTRADAPKEAVDFLKEKLSVLKHNEELKAQYIKEGIDYGVFTSDELLNLTSQFKKQLELVMDEMGTKE